MTEENQAEEFPKITIIKSSLASVMRGVFVLLLRRYPKATGAEGRALFIRVQKQVAELRDYVERVYKQQGKQVTRPNEWVAVAVIARVMLYKIRDDGAEVEDLVAMDIQEVLREARDLAAGDARS